MRWTIRRKAEFVEQTKNLSELELTNHLAAANVSFEELSRWRQLIQQGVRALRATRIQDYRRAA